MRIGQIVAITAAIVWGTSFSAMADQNTVRAIATDLYANENDTTIRQLGIDSMVASVTKANPGEWFTKVGEYAPDAKLLMSSNAVASTYPYAFAKRGDKVFVALANANTEENIAQNEQYIHTLYNVAKKIKTETANMDEFSKAKYIADYICTHSSYDYTHSNYGAAPMLATGKGTCQSYAALFYILGRYCGLQTNVVAGQFKTGSVTTNHTWNEINIQGKWMFVDLTSFDTKQDAQYLFQPIEKESQIYTQYTGNYDQVFEVFKKNQ